MKYNHQNERKLLLKMAEDTIYSAKGHFKACDIRRNAITITIFVCIILNILGIISIGNVIDRCLSAICLIGTIALLIWDYGEGKDYRAKHKATAEKYLALHKEIRNYYFLYNYTKEQVEQLSKKVILLDQSEKLEIPFFARKLAKRAIEKKDPEIDNWFLSTNVDKQ
ncbi:MAG: hypothetical protein LBS26_00505 [Campylobacteraceae bacterium]|nr:hypothetical protein [Campylobacteraceae bacterium]